MAKAKIAITLDPRLVRQLDRMVAADDFRNRSQAIETAVKEFLKDGSRLAYLRALKKIDPAEEVSFAQERYGADVAWPPW